LIGNFGSAETDYYNLRRLLITDSTLTALIAEGTSGIGFATARKLALLGIYTLAAGRNAESSLRRFSAAAKSNTCAEAP
jgi:NAD(P)-dependent dehydrogenase (short-subunit alcohol dehydrogenase family)